MILKNVYTCTYYCLRLSNDNTSSSLRSIDDNRDTSSGDDGGETNTSESNTIVARIDENSPIRISLANSGNFNEYKVIRMEIKYTTILRSFLVIFKEITHNSLSNINNASAVNTAPPRVIQISNLLDSINETMVNAIPAINILLPSLNLAIQPPN
ncbi:MAG: hypothetical protein ISS48_00645 [Candidatus Aenigmarchaeota archaeon]|nr:hypothetical protein [Candidatus Aenigmarchaeota archaeon]